MSEVKFADTLTPASRETFDKLTEAIGIPSVPVISKTDRFLSRQKMLKAEKANVISAAVNQLKSYAGNDVVIVDTIVKYNGSIKLTIEGGANYVYTNKNNTNNNNNSLK